MKQTCNVTGMTCPACPAPRGTSRPARPPLSFICPGGVNPPGIKVLLRKTLVTRHLARMGRASLSERLVLL